MSDDHVVFLYELIEEAVDFVKKEFNLFTNSKVFNISQIVVLPNVKTARILLTSTITLLIFQKTMWNYFATSHGKQPYDGIGGTK